MDTDQSSVVLSAEAGARAALARPREEQCPALGCAPDLRLEEDPGAEEAVPWMARAYPATPEGPACSQRPDAKAGSHRHWVPQVLALMMQVSN